MAAIAAMQKPESNPAQNYLTQNALEGADFLKKGEFSQMPKGMFFDFKNPVEQMKQYDEQMNVGKEGTYALGDSEGAGKAQALAGDYRKNLASHAFSQNYQDNISNAAGHIQGALGQAAGAKGASDAAVVSALNNLYQFKKQANSQNGVMGFISSLAGTAGSLGAAAMSGGSSAAA